MGREEAERSFDAPVLAETTLPRMFETVAERHADRPAQHYKGGVYDRSMAGAAYPAAPDGEYASLTYEEMRDVVWRLATGLRDLGIRPGDRVGIFADTRMEWAQTDFAVQAAGGVVTTVYKASSPDQVSYLLEDPGARGVILEGESELATALGESQVDLEFYVAMDDPGRFSYHDDVYSLGEVYERGDAGFGPDSLDSWLDERSLGDLASLVYTSGTTGEPKGVRLSHQNVRTNVNQTYRRYGPRPDTDESESIGPHTRTVSFLPLAHVFERTAGHFLIFAAGGSVGYAESVDTLREDFQLVEPTAATSVPRVYERIYAAIREQAQESSLKERIFEWAVDVGRAYHRDPDSAWNRARYALADRLVFSDVREALGGNVDFLVSGGGTLSAELTELYHGMGLPIYEGYGLTEAAPIVTANPPTEPKPGTIGPALPGVDVEVDPDPVAEADLGGENVGELLVKGPNVSDGYWKRPIATSEAFTEDGYLRTGDVVRERPDGYFEFEERLKQLIVLSTGKNIPPAPIEESFAAINVVDQVMVVGDDRKFVSALVVPDFDALRWFAESQGVDLPADRAAVCEDDRARELIEQEIDRVNENFEEHERIKKFRVVPEPFTQENGLLTPTLKKKRHLIREKYEGAIAEMYGDRGFERARTE